MTLTEVWINCAETIAEVIEAQERKLSLLVANSDSDPADIRRTWVALTESRAVLADFTRRYLKEF